MEFEFDIYKVGNELFGICLDVSGKIYGLHLTGREPRKAIGIYICSVEYKSLIGVDDGFARVWIEIYNRIKGSHFDVNHVSAAGKDIMLVVRGKRCIVDNVWEYTYNEYDTPPLNLFMVDGKRVA